MPLTHVQFSQEQAVSEHPFAPNPNQNWFASDFLILPLVKYYFILLL